MEHDTGSPGLPDTPQRPSTIKPSLKQRIIPPVRGVFNRILSVDRAIHAQIESRFPNALLAFDAVFGGVFYILCHSAFALILALGLGVLTLTGVVENVVYVSVAVIWLVLTLWIWRSEKLKKLSVLSRMIVVGALALSIGIVCRSFGNYALRKYAEQQAKQKQQQDIAIIKEEPKEPESSITPSAIMPTVTPTPAPSPLLSPPSAAPKPRSKRQTESEFQRRQRLLRELEGRN